MAVFFVVKTNKICFGDFRIRVKGIFIAVILRELQE